MGVCSCLTTFDTLGGTRLRAHRIALVCALAACLVALPSVALGNMVIPIAVVAFPAMLVMFLPVALIEAYVFRARLALGFRRALWVVTVANAVSTVVGIPLANLVILPATRVAFIGGSGEDSWDPASSLLFLLIPLFYGSAFIEYLVARRMLSQLDDTDVAIAVGIANVASYLLITGVLIALKVGMY
jgi:hypothetical protein